MEKINRLDGTWRNGAFKVKLKGNAYISYYGKRRYGKGTFIYDNEKFTLTSTHARCLFYWTPFVEVVTGKFVKTNGELTVFAIEGRYSDYNGTWTKLK